MGTLKSFFKYVSLNILGMAALSCYILADTFFIAKALGANGLAALNLSISVFSMISAVGLMLGIGGGTKFAILRSQSPNQKDSSIFTSITSLGMLLGLGSMAAGIFFSKPLAKALGADAYTLPLTAVYLQVILCFAPFFIFNNILLAFVRNDGSPKLCMTAMITGSLCNVVLDYVFMFPLQMGMFGAAFATGLAPVISLGILSLHFIKKKNSFGLNRKKIHIKLALSALPLGITSFIAELSSGIVLVIFNLQLLRISGNVGVAAYGIIANIALVCVAVFTGIAQGIQPLISHAYGAGDKPSLFKVKRYALLLSLALALLFYVTGTLFSDGIVHVFNSEGNLELAAIAEHGIAIYFLGFMFLGINMTSAAFYSAAAKPAIGIWTALIRGCLAILPLSLILPRFLGIDGVWLAFVLSEVFACLYLVGAAFMQRKKSKLSAELLVDSSFI